MGANTKIEWPDHTFNPWIGCTKVSPGCKNCYAERDMDHRFGRVQWGPQGQRVRTSEANWRKPLAWNSQQWGQCSRCGWRGHIVGMHKGQLPFCGNCGSVDVVPARARVFCASVADVFEDNDQLLNWRHDLFYLIRQTPNLDHLLLTKRAGIARQFFRLHPDWLFPNVWLGVSVENQATADERIPHLLEVPAAVRFLSCEPLLGPIDLSPYLRCRYDHNNDGDCHIHRKGCPHIDGVIVGGESGPKARPTHPDWVRSLRDQCVAAGVPFFFKQWGEWYPAFDATASKSFVWDDGERVFRVGRKAAGRLLDGREWNEFPQVEKRSQ